MEEIDPIIQKSLWEPLPDMAQITKESGRWYEFCDKGLGDDKYYSVTTIIDSAKSVSSKKAIEDWKRSEIRQGLDPNRYSRDGDKMHELIENYIIQGYKYPKAEQCKGRGYQLFKQYEQGFLKKVSITPHIVEGRVFADVNGLRYAGTIDLVATVQTEPEGKEELAIIDHKSVSEIKKASSKRKGYLPQLAAYAKAIKDRYGKVVDCAYLNFASEKSFKSYRIDMEEILENWDRFYYNLHGFYEKKEFPVE